MRPLAAWPAKSLFLADAASLVAGLVVFRANCVRWSPEEFAGWEWLRVWLGLCMLIPRNGLDVVAQRCAVLRPRQLRLWTGVLLAVRAPLSLAAMGLFLLIGRTGAVSDWSVLIPLAATAPVSACVPDLAARVQGRFRVAGSLLLARNAILAAGVSALPQMTNSPAGLAWLTLATEGVVGLLWWADAWRHGGLPGGRWRRLMWRARRPLTSRSWDQSLARWFRVASWNVDALLAAPLWPELWRTIAPARTLLMTAAMPAAGYLGAIGPLMARRPRADLTAQCVRGVRACVVAGALAAALASAFGESLSAVLFGESRRADSLSMALTAARFAPIVAAILITQILTSQRRDRAARFVAAIFPLSSATLAAASQGWAFGNERWGYLSMVMGEWLAIVVGLAVVSSERARFRFGFAYARACVSRALRADDLKHLRDSRRAIRGPKRMGEAVERC